MAPIAIAPTIGSSRTRASGHPARPLTSEALRKNAGSELLGVKRPTPRPLATSVRATTVTQGAAMSRDEEPSVVVSEAKPIRTQPSEFEKVVRKIPTLYVIAFFAVVVLCAVSIIWNTLQVNRLTLQRMKLDDQIAQTEQRLLKLQAEEMQLSAQSRIEDIAQNKLGMTDAMNEDLVIVR